MRVAHICFPLAPSAPGSAHCSCLQRQTVGHHRGSGPLAHSRPLSHVSSPICHFYYLTFSYAELLEEKEMGEKKEREKGASLDSKKEFS